MQKEQKVERSEGDKKEGKKEEQEIDKKENNEALSLIQSRNYPKIKQ